LDVLPALAGPFDALILDPPFGIGFDYGNRKDVASTANEYWQWFEPIYDYMLSFAVPGAFVAIWQTQLYFRHFWEWFGNDIHIYCAAKNFVQLHKTPINYGYDPVVMRYLDGPTVLRPDRPRRNLDFFVANTAGIVSDPTRIERQHPCPRPLDAVREIVDNFALPGGIVLDPFMGSGTTGAACVQTGRRFVGIDISPEYCAIAQRRIQEAIDCPPAPVKPAPPAKCAADHINR